MKNYFPCELKMDFPFGRESAWKGKNEQTEVCIEQKIQYSSSPALQHSLGQTITAIGLGGEKTCAELEYVSLCLQLLFFVLLCTLKKKVRVPKRERKKPVVFSYLDVCSRQVILCQDEVIEGDIICYCHTAGVDLEDPSFGLLIGKGKLNLTVDSP